MVVGVQQNLEVGGDVRTLFLGVVKPRHFTVECTDDA